MPQGVRNPVTFTAYGLPPGQYVLNHSKAVWQIQFVCTLGMAGQALVNSMSRKIYVSLKRNVIACTLP